MSITYFILGIVIEVSAMFVANTTFRIFEGTGRQASNCCAGGNPANNGQTRILPLISYNISNNKYLTLKAQC